jgi:hypothetical protein
VEGHSKFRPSERNYTGWKGGELVFRHRVAVYDEPPRPYRAAVKKAMSALGPKAGIAKLAEMSAFAAH